MPRYRLRTLLILLAVLPPIGAGGYWAWRAMQPKEPAWWQIMHYDLGSNGPMPIFRRLPTSEN
jgi:hypothetical protein